MVTGSCLMAQGSLFMAHAQGGPAQPQGPGERRAQARNGVTKYAKYHECTTTPTILLDALPRAGIEVSL